MGALADRLAFLLREWGMEPAARQPELHALASLEARDQAQAVARFHEHKRAWAAQRRGELLHRLRQHAFVAELPPDEVEGMTQREIEREIRWLAAAAQHARAADDAERAVAELLPRLRARRAPPLPDLGAASWLDLRPVAERAEARRRLVAREARIEERAEDARRRVAKLQHRRVDAPDVATRDADEASRLLDATEEALGAAEDAEDAHRAVAAMLRDPAMREYRARSRAALEAQARALVALPDAREAAEKLRALLPQAETLREEAAREASAAKRARRAGRAGGATREARPGDTMDGYS